MYAKVEWIMVMIKRAILIFAAALLLFWFTIPQNHTEAEDAFSYAADVENRPMEELFFTTHLIYRPLMRSLWLGANAAGYTGRAYELMLRFSLVCGALTIAFLYLLFMKLANQRASGSNSKYPEDHNNCDPPPIFTERDVVWTSALLALLLAVSYNFWRYSCEVETYIPATLFVMLTLLVSVGGEINTRRVFAGALLATLSIMFHIANAAFALIFMPLYFTLRRKTMLALIYSATVLLALFAVFIPLNSICDVAKGSAIDSQPAEAGFQLENIVRATAAFGQCILSGNFLFASDKFCDWIQERYPYRMLAEEIYMGQHAYGSAFWSGVVTSILFGVTFLLTLVLALSGSKRLAFLRHKFELLSALAAWLVAYTTVMIGMEPGNPEMWILLILPFWLFVGIVLMPIISRKTGKWLLFTFFLSLVAHNWSGGMAMLQDNRGNYNHSKVEWALELANAEDVLLTAGSPVFSSYLEYRFAGEVINLNTVDQIAIADLWQDLRCKGGDLYAFDDIFRPPRSLGVRFPGREKHIESIASFLAPHFERVHTNEFGGVWEATKFYPNDSTKKPRE